MINLNTKQLEAVEKIEYFLNTDEKEFLLTGRAGTGKTTTVKYISYPYKVIGMALSHKAKEVLTVSLNRPCITVAAAIGLEKVEDDSTGEIAFIPFGKGIVLEKIIFIVDECSMISSLERSRLLELYPNSKFIYLGDTYQLPPIKEIECPIFIDSEIQSVELEENMRTGDSSPIMDLLNNLVSLQNKSDVTVKDIYDSLPKTDIIIRDKALLVKKSIGEIVKTYQNAIMITYHVKKKDSLNDSYRHNILKTTEPYIIGDKLIFNNNIYENERKIFTNSEIVTVNDIQETRYTKTLKIYKLVNNELVEELLTIDEPFYILTVNESNFPLIVPKDIKKFGTLIESIKKHAISLNYHFKERKIMWRTYFDLLRAYYDVSYAYAITSHKSQGSTYNVVIVDVNDILTSHMTVIDKLKCLYVACSRASNILNIIY